MIKSAKTVVFLLALSGFSTIHGGFLVDENPDPEVIKPEESQSVTKSVGYPENTALNITVTPIEGIPDSVLISWTLSAGSDDTFIVGRSNSMLDDKEHALNALSIRLVPSGTKNSVIDRGLPPGRYFYTVLSKKKSAKKEIDLYPNENYTTNPVIISSDTPPQRGSVQQVRGISASILQDSSVQIMWQPLSFVGVKYNVYRSSSPVDTAEKVSTAEKIGEISDRDKFIDRNAPAGLVYYAVTAVDRYGNEDKNLIADESYMTKGVYILESSYSSVVSGLTASTLVPDSVKLSWNRVKSEEGSYSVFRSSSIIDSPEKLSSAEFIASVPLKETNYSDRKSGPGSFYYAVLLKNTSGVLNTEFYAGYNFTTVPAQVAIPENPVKLRIIKAEAKNSDVNITWSYTGEDHKEYLLFRSEFAPQSKNDVSDAFLIASIDLRRNSFRDSNLPSGTYYYSLVPHNYMDNSSFVLRKGVHVTSVPVEIKNDISDPDFTVRTFSSQFDEKSGDVRISWKHSGESGIKNYMIFRLNSVPKTKEDIASGVLAGNTDITAGTFADRPEEPGRYYYSIVPEDYLSREQMIFVRGVNVSPVAVQYSAPSSVKKVINEDYVPEDKPGRIKQPEKSGSGKKAVAEKSKTPEKRISATSVDAVLKKYFYKSRYIEAIAALKSISSASSGSERARSLYFTGRCYAEKGDYYTALKYFLNQDVVNEMPDEAEFWQNFCIKKTSKR